MGIRRRRRRRNGAAIPAISSRLCRRIWRVGRMLCRLRRWHSIPHVRGEHSCCKRRSSVRSRRRRRGEWRLQHGRVRIAAAHGWRSANVRGNPGRRNRRHDDVPPDGAHAGRLCQRLRARWYTGTFQRCDGRSFDAGGLSSRHAIRRRYRRCRPGLLRVQRRGRVRLVDHRRHDGWLRSQRDVYVSGSGPGHLDGGRCLQHRQRRHLLDESERGAKRLEHRNGAADDALICERNGDGSCARQC